VRGFRDAVVLAVVLVLQGTFVHRIAIAGIRPDLLVAFVVYFGWMRGAVAGTVGGFAVGLLLDLDAPGPLGLNALANAVVGFLVAKAGLRVHRSNLGVRFVFFLTALVVHDLIYFAVYTGGDPIELARALLVVAIPTALYTAVFVIALLQIVERFSKSPLLADPA
jgi:rod shape-determining protein MreD